VNVRCAYYTIHLPAGEISSVRRLVIMDEVDGMGGSDRGMHSDDDGDEDNGDKEEEDDNVVVDDNNDDDNDGGGGGGGR